jgi:hypothetical protein
MNRMAASGTWSFLLGNIAVCDWSSSMKRVLWCVFHILIVLMQLRTCVCRVGLIVGYSITCAMVASVGKSSLIPNRCMRSSMSVLLVAASISSVRLSSDIGCSGGIKMSLFALKVVRLHSLIVIFSSVFSRLCFRWSVASRWKSGLCSTFCNTSWISDFLYHFALIHAPNACSWSCLWFLIQFSRTNATTKRNKEPQTASRTSIWSMDQGKMVQEITYPRSIAESRTQPRLSTTSNTPQ